MGNAIRKFDAAIKSHRDSILRKGESRVRGFGSAVDSAKRSRAMPNSETSPVHGFDSAVDTVVRSRATPNWETTPVHGFGSAVDSAIRSKSEPNFETIPVRGFGSAVDSAIRSKSEPNFETVPIRGFGSAVDGAIRSKTEPNFETSHAVYSYGWVVDNAIGSKIAPNPPPVHGFASEVEHAIGSDVGGGEAENEIEAVTGHDLGPNRDGYYSGSWQKGDILGKGSFGTVYEGFTDDGNFFAVKEVSLLDHRSQGRESIFQLRQEISLLSQFRHDNIVQYLGTNKDNDKLYIFLELVTKGSLAFLYQRYCLVDSQVSAYTRQILSGLKYLHDRNVVHRDIKCANILVDASGSVKLADFGLAKVAKLNDVKSVGGSLYWMAPEVVTMRNHGYGLAADIWSLGCTVLEMLTRKPPYSHLGECLLDAQFRIGRGKLPPVPESLSTDARDFILTCLQVNPNKRPTAAQLLDHPFVNIKM
ncbi:unnamed protein product [Sphenostylis stenocarpa]|uniref:mitogen-activated protein kinase kinase kinase n=1 Tax=Sphenostylis stenocarpa TaxID=92480 RepID=A0AA86T5J8_9FABA|nr:unnamed protein product [Sphenostylis stenocarpa]